MRLRAVGRIQAREDLKVGQAFEMADNAEVFCPSFKSDEELDSYLRSIAPPRELVCPITQEVLKDPVVAADGHTYERASLLTWYSMGR